MRSLRHGVTEVSYRLLFERGPIGLFVTTPDGVILEANASLERILGAPESSGIVGRNLVDLWVDPDDGADVLDRAAQAETPQEVEVRYRRLDASDGWALVSVVAAFAPEGTLDHFEGSLQDITERKAVELRLREMEARYRGLIEQIPAITVVGQPGVPEAEYVSPQIEGILGYRPDEFVEPGFWQRCVHPDDLPLVLEEVARSIQSKDPFSARFRVIAKDGREVWLRLDTTLITDAAGVPQLMQGVAFDITEAKRTELGLQEQDRRLRAVLDSIDEILFEFDEDGTYLNVWTADESLLALPKEEFLGRTMPEVLGETEAGPLLEAIRRVISTGVTETVEFSLKARGAHSRFRGRIAPVVSDQGRVRTVSFMVHDISPERRAAAELEASEQRFRRLIENLPDVVFRIGLSPEPHVEYISPQVEALTGYTPEEYRTDPGLVMRALHPGDRGRLYRALGSSSPPSEPLELRIIRKDGTLVWTEQRHSLVRDERGTLAIEGVQWDVTKRHLAEEELAARLHQQAAVAELGVRALAGAEPSVLMDDACHLVAETLGVEFCELLELLPGGEELLLRAGVGWRPGAVGTERVPAGPASQGGYTVAAGRPVLVEDLAAETRFTPPPLFLDHGVRSGITVGVYGPDELFGVLGAHTAFPRRFSDDDINFLRAVANILGTAMARTADRYRLEEAERRFRTLVEEIPAITYLFPLAADVPEYVSPQVRTLLGVDPDELVGGAVRWADFILPEDRDRIAANFLELALRGGRVSEDVRLQARDGRVLWFRGDAVTVADEEGRPAFVQGVLLDVTEQREMQAAVERSEAIYRALSELVTDLAFVRGVNPDGSLTWLWSSQAVWISGQSIEELEEMGGWESVVHSDDLERFREHVRRVIGGEGSEIEYRNVLGTGEIQWVRTVAQPVFQEDEGRVVRFYGASTDITEHRRRVEERRELMARLVASQEEERLRIAREMHDGLGQDLTSISLSVARLAMRAEGESARIVASLEKLVERTIAQTRDIVRNLRPIELERLGLSGALRQLVDDLAVRHDLPIDIDAPDSDPKLPSDVQMAVYRVIQEGLTNVIRHSGARSASVVVSVHDDVVTVVIEDDGEGFDPGATVGAGRLGLVGMEERAAQVGGTVVVDSAPGVGTTVRMEVPLR